jgi:mannosyltransferase OCH1-like enzyme
MLKFRERFTTESTIYNKLKQLRYPLKRGYIKDIPLNIYQTWHATELPEHMAKCIQQIRRENPEFNYCMSNDAECRAFIEANYEADVLNAFDALIPGAYKADLWRYCVLYKQGGIYLDIKYQPMNGFRFITLTEKEHLVMDRDKTGIYNALMVCRPGNALLLRAIHQIVKNVEIRYYGNNPLDPTGPGLLARLITMDERRRMLDMKHQVFFDDFNYRTVLYKNHMIFHSYNGYIKEHDTNKKVAYYGDLWNRRQIYTNTSVKPTSSTPSNHPYLNPRINV